MPEVVELADGEKPRADERYALVCVSSKPPVEGASTSAHEFGQAFFADDDEHDVSLMVGRAKVWAVENNIARVYVRRDRQ
jgi:hypothetical protein